MIDSTPTPMSDKEFLLLFEWIMVITIWMIIKFN